MERVQKLLSQAGYGSRRACEIYIVEGRVRVNGKVVTLGAQADPLKDVIEVDGERLNLRAVKKQYIAFYKPPNVLSTNIANYQDDRPTVRDLIPIEGHLFTIGRLDAESEGLIVLTNDGEMANKLSHPRYNHTKTYLVTVYGRPDKDVLNQWQDGIWLDGERSAPCYVNIVETTPDTTVLRVIMTEGKKRQIRRVASALGYPVKRLVRTHIGMLGLGKLKRGEWIELNKLQIQELQTPAPELDLIKKRRKLLRRTNRPAFKTDDDKAKVPRASRDDPHPKPSSTVRRKPVVGRRPNTRNDGAGKGSAHGKPSGKLNRSSRQTGSSRKSSGKKRRDDLE